MLMFNKCIQSRIFLTGAQFWVVAVPKNNHWGSPGMAGEARASQGYLQLAAGT